MTPETERRPKAQVVWAIVAGVVLSLTLVACAAPPEPAPPTIQAVAASTDPADWADAYPVQYADWLATSDPRPEGKSVYKRGFDGGYTFDKLSEFPFMPVIFKGWGFGIDYNEPRGHYFMMVDQQEADPSRVKAGGACLTCKSPSANALYEQYGADVMSMPYTEALELLPEGQEELGVSCIDCHDNKTLELRSDRWTMERALSDIGLEAPNDEQQRMIVCGQCHCTYSVMKDDGASVDVNFPWQGGSWGDVSIETIVANLEAYPARLEWTQETTGFKLGFIRHPDVEFFTADSVHYNAGLSCPDCHMPYKVVDGTKTADHNVMSPLKQDMKACVPCHPEDAQELRDQVIELQDRNASMLMDTGYAVAANAKLFETINASVDLSAPDIKTAYDEAAALYRQAFYRVVYMGAENSMGFHNPSEGGRILRDAMAYSSRCDSILRTIAASAGLDVPAEIDLQLEKYLVDRGEKKLGFVKANHFPDPYPTNTSLWPNNAAALEAVPVTEPFLSSTREH